MNSLEVGKAITTKLAGVPAFAFLAPAGTTGAFLVYQLGGLRVATSKDRYNFKEVATVDISVVADTYRASVDLAQRVRDTLEPFEGELCGIDIGDISLINARASSDGDLYVHVLTYQIIIV